jgi:choline dehydrogenase-like flavoprotein
MKIGAAVATPALLRATMATKGIADELDMSKVAVYYISIDSSGRSGLIPIGKGLFPFFLPNKDMKSQIDLAAKTLYKAIYSAGGQILGDRNPTVSTVHVFGSLPIGKSPVVDSQGVVRGTQGRIFVRDASLLPSHPRVNPQGPLMHLIETLEGHQPALQESEQ